MVIFFPPVIAMVILELVMVTAMILNIPQTTILAHGWFLLVKTYKFNRMPKRGVAVSFTSNYPAFNLNRWDFIDQLHGRFLSCILHPFLSVGGDDLAADCATASQTSPARTHKIG